MPRSKVRLDFARGGCAALILGILGAVAPVTLMFGVTVAGWLLFGSSGWDRRYDLAWLRDRMGGPMLGCATVFAAAGWATFAPPDRRRFTPTLLLISLSSLGLWAVLTSLPLKPTRLKGIDHPEFYPTELLLIIGPPIVVAVGLSLIRDRRASLPKPPVRDEYFDQG